MKEVSHSDMITKLCEEARARPLNGKKFQRATMNVEIEGRFSVNGVQMLILPGASNEELASDAGCFISVIDGLAHVGAVSGEDSENMFHAIRYLAVLAQACTNEIESMCTRERWAAERAAKAKGATAEEEE